MKSPAEVQTFLQAKRIALVGASRDPRAFSSTVLRAFREAGYKTIPVNGAAAEAGHAVAGQRAFASLEDVAPPPDAAVVMTPKGEARNVVADAVRAGVTKLWLFGAGVGPSGVDAQALGAAREAGMLVVAGECPLMFLPRSGFIHRAHGLIRGLGQGWAEATPDGSVPTSH